MQIDIQTKGVELTEEIEQLVFQKLGVDIDKYLTKFDDDIKKAEVRIEEGDRWGYKVSFSMWLPKKEHIYAEDTDEMLVTAISSLEDLMQREVRRYKEKLHEYND